jgi:hydroxymethylpyrimidine pyrophosphatase-like HAD family hydrolase
MRISLDLHGVVNANPNGFAEYAKQMTEDGHEVYILTGSAYADAISELAEMKFDLRNIKEIISTTDYLLDKDVPWEYDHYGRPSFNPTVWWGAKGQIAREKNIDLHIDDGVEYEKTFTTPFMLYEGV